MLDFVDITTETKSLPPKKLGNKQITVVPDFRVSRHKDLIIKGKDFYAFYDESTQLWNRTKEDVVHIIDSAVRDKVESYPQDASVNVVGKYMDKYEPNGPWERFIKYCRTLDDNYEQLDTRIAFAHEDLKKTDYCSRRLKYDLDSKNGCPCYEEIASTLYSQVERQKFEWGIGSIFAGEYLNIQKMYAFYGAPKTGKSTILNIIEKLFEGYAGTFNISSIVSQNNQFALSKFGEDKLVLIQHDANLSKVSTNNTLNSIIAHETVEIDQKYKKPYDRRATATIFIGTNSPIQITDAKSGLARRIIDISPTGKLIPKERYDYLMQQIPFELGAIAYHCLQVFESLGVNAYNNYTSFKMISETDNVYDFMFENYYLFKEQDGTFLRQAWELWQNYVVNSNLSFIKMPKTRFKTELKEYFEDYSERASGDFLGFPRPRSIYLGFKTYKFDGIQDLTDPLEDKQQRLELNAVESNLDKLLENEKAQYCKKDGTPRRKWENVRTKLKDLDTHELHYVLVPHNHIVLDFDLKDSEGNKDLDKNLREAAKYPATYAELSKSGGGVHLHYIYDGDPDELSSEISPGIEIKVFSDKQGIRRQLTKCNSLPVNYISSGLPLKQEKGGDKMFNETLFVSEQALRKTIEKCLNKEVHSGTKPNVDFIKHILDQAYESGEKYDVSDMKSRVTSFAAKSTHHSDYCLELVTQMHFASDEPSECYDNNSKPIAFFDVEVFPNFFCVCLQPDKVPDDVEPQAFINPTAEAVRELVNKYRLIGFNNRRYDNHILYGRMQGYNNEETYRLSKNIIDNVPHALFGEAYNLSYTDILDFSSKKQSLKKFEIEMGIRHMENEYPWDEPLTEEQQLKVVEYCQNDVKATKALFYYRHDDFVAREILADIAGKSVNDTTNNLTTAIIFGRNRKPQSCFNYTDLSEMFPGYVFDHGKSTYQGEIVGEGGYVYSEPGYYEDVALLDIASMHPSSIIALNLFGDTYTTKFRELVEARIAIKHLDFEKAKKMFNGALEKYLSDSKSAKALAGALKIAINSVYGLTAAKFDNAFRDPRNVDNIVAKRGALFMVNLKNECIARGMKVIHIKTDSIKIANATPEDIQFVTDYGKEYGYNFEHEATYSKICLVNDAVYISQYAASGEWNATGAEFQDPYVFKKLFSHEQVDYDDMIQTKSVAKGAIYLAPEIDADPSTFKFIGKIGTFVPVKPPKGGILLVEREGKYTAVSGSKGLRWSEAELIRDNSDLIQILDMEYYNKLIDDAIAHIEEYVQFEDFVEELPW